MSWNNFRFRPYVPVAERRRKALQTVTKMEKQGKTILPVKIEGRTIARSFWGKAWCDNLESYSDYENRLPRGRTYVRNGSVVHLEVGPGVIQAMVSGSELYRVSIKIKPAQAAKWKALCRECAGGIGSLIELLQGRFSSQVMQILTRRETGLFPSPAEIDLDCSCPDWADMCKHVAAVLYGVGSRLDHSPELLFTLRSVHHEELISQAAQATDLAAQASGAASELSESEMSSVFGIELDTTPAAAPSAVPEGKAAQAPKAAKATKSAKPAKKAKKIAAAPAPKTAPAKLKASARAAKKAPSAGARKKQT
jgi:uncharacterized Zn finger protein